MKQMANTNEKIRRIRETQSRIEAILSSFAQKEDPDPKLPPDPVSPEPVRAASHTQGRKMLLRRDEKKQMKRPMIFNENQKNNIAREISRSYNIEMTIKPRLLKGIEEVERVWELLQEIDQEWFKESYDEFTEKLLTTEIPKFEKLEKALSSCSQESDFWKTQAVIGAELEVFQKEFRELDHEVEFVSSIGEEECEEEPLDYEPEEVPQETVETKCPDAAYAQGKGMKKK